MQSAAVRASLLATLLMVAAGGLVSRCLAPENAETVAIRLSERLVGKHGLLLLLTFDESRTHDWARGWQVLAPGTESVPGRHGRGRFFAGSSRAFVQTSMPWSQCGDTYTLSTWVKLDAVAPDQDILFSAGEGRRTGLTLDGGYVTLDVPFEQRQALSYPFARYGELVNLVAVVDAAAKRAWLYENGVVKASRAITGVTMPDANVTLGTRQWYAVRNPLRGTVDETAIWKRALPPAEIERLFASPTDMLETLEPALARSFRLRLLAEAAKTWVAKASDYIRLDVGSDSASAEPLPHLNLILSGADRRHLRKAHERSLRSGRRVRDAARPRSMRYVASGMARQGRLHLYGSDVWYQESVRPSYILEPAMGASCFGSGRLRLAPPESSDFLFPIVETRLAAQLGAPAVANGYCLLSINGRSKGVYYWEDMSKMGVFAGQEKLISYRPRSPQEWPELFNLVTRPTAHLLTPPGLYPVLPEAVHAIFDELAGKYAKALLQDALSPLTARQRRERLARDREQSGSHWRLASPEWSPARRAAAYLSPYAILGGNPSPAYITGDLSLDGLRLPGVTLTWSSSNPDLIAADGSVTRPHGTRPVGVDLSVRIADQHDQIQMPFHLRVMPDRPSLPALMIYTDVRVQKTRRVDAVVAWYEAGVEGPSRILNATQGFSGGITHRGNSSYWLPKKRFTIRTDLPHHLFGDTTARHLLLVSSPLDPTFSHNAFAYGVFRDLAAPGAARYAPEVRWAEVFFNGTYLGLYEVWSRIDDEVLTAGQPQATPALPPLLFKLEYVRDSTRTAADTMRQTQPDRRAGDFLDAYERFAAFVETAPPERFRAEVGRIADVANVIDFHLLLNLTGNRNGYPFRYPAHDILARGGGPEGRFFFVAWDFDATFYPRKEGWITNALIWRLENELPGYRQRFLSRWRELRRGALALEPLLGRLDAIEKTLDGYVEWELAKWPRVDEVAHGDYMADLKIQLRSRVQRLDEYLPQWAAKGP
ncbi:MAG: CotH kinase family protein [Candidatus Schekmanbacteria bacterium]|nr:CotH kinase family protein [Candidatus Schekmanbacteria bacterium]